MDLDRIDYALLAALARNARLSHVELSNAIGLSTTACARRMKALEEAGIIAGYRAELGLKLLGLSTQVLVRITLESQSEETLQAFETAVAACPSVVRCLLMSGSDDYIVTVIARDIEDYEQIHKTQLSRLPKVARLQSSFALRQVIDRPLPPSAYEPVRRKHA